MASKHLSFFPLLLLLLLLATVAHAKPVNITWSGDITTVLKQFPNFSTLNKLLTQTKVASDINSRQTITVFVVADSAISSLTSLPSDVQQKVLSLHVVLDYYDVDKLTNLPNTTSELTTLFQASGKAVKKNGFINATDVGDGQIKLGSAEDNQLTSDVIREIAMQPFNISIVEISQMIIPSSVASGGSNGSSSGGSSSAATPTPAPKADKSGAPKAAPVPSGSSSAAPKSNSSDETPAPSTTTDAPRSSATDAPAGSVADAPAGPMDDAKTPATAEKKSSSASRLGVRVGIGAAMGAALLAAL